MIINTSILPIKLNAKTAEFLLTHTFTKTLQFNKCDATLLPGTKLRLQVQAIKNKIKYFHFRVLR